MRHRVALWSLLLFAGPLAAQEVETTVVEVAVATTPAWGDPGMTARVGTVVQGQVYLRVGSQGGMARVLWSASAPTYAWLEERALRLLPGRKKYLVRGEAGFRSGWLVAPMGIDELPVGPETEGSMIVAHAGETLTISTKLLLLASDTGPRNRATVPSKSAPGARRSPVGRTRPTPPAVEASTPSPTVPDAPLSPEELASRTPPGQRRLIPTRAGKLDLTRAVYPPRSPEAVALFEEAARVAGLPLWWARSEGLHKLLDAESDGWVGRPNYTYDTPAVKRSLAQNRHTWPAIHAELKRGYKSTKSSATGIGQLLLDNVRRYYPGGVNGIGDPLKEAVGMLRYIELHKNRSGGIKHGDPDRAWANYNKEHEGY